MGDSGNLLQINQVRYASSYAVWTPEFEVNILLNLYNIRTNMSGINKLFSKL